MHRLIYVSAAVDAMTPDVLAQILEASRRNNPKAGITGMLLYIDGGFLQLLEGPEEAVHATYDRICRDRRHDEPRVLLDRAAEGRLFPDWTMGFEEPLQGHPDTGGIFEASKAAIEGAVSEQRAAEIAILLRTFYRVNTSRDAA